MSRILIFTHWKQFSILSIALASFYFSVAQNPIVTENNLPGSPASEWDISGAGDLSIQGFATDISINKGDTVHFKIKTDATNYTITIYRLGYYGGMGARNVGTGTVTATLPQIQPSPITDPVTGLVDCGNWNESAYWHIPSTAVSGIYLARLNRTDNSGSSHIVFIVRDDASHSDLFFQASDATWQAYNNYGGNSLYLGTTSLPSGHASKVSYNRPFLTRNGGGGGGTAQDWLFNAEYPMIRFLERNGYDMTYTTNVDAARFGSLILNHKVFLSVGHDEYWSTEQRSNVEAARNSGVHLAFFSGNEVYWKTRWENSFDGSNTSYRTLVCYKEGTLGEAVCGTKCDPTPEWTGLWRDGCNYPSAGGCSPENALTGSISWQNSSGAITIPAAYKNLRFWRYTSVATLDAENTVTLPDGVLGHEWSFEQYPNSYPHGRITLSSTTIDGFTHKLSLYRHPSGALVFGAGTIQWAWGLDDNHDRGNLPASQDMQQATINLFADMGVQPGKLQAGLTPTSQSTDFIAPVSTITSAANGASFPSYAPVTIEGTSSDDNTVAGIEISLDGGTTWQVANGTHNWNFTWTPTTQGTVTILVRGFDDSGNMETPGSVPSSNAITINITEPHCPCTIYQPVDTPAVTNSNDGSNGIELGVKFRASINGYITGLRFYKSSNDTGMHIASLWTLNGTLLARDTFTNETATGWQEVFFNTPVAVTANTTYVASYNSPSGYYAQTSPYFDTEHVNGPLTAIARTDPDGPNAVYEYSGVPVFPASNSQTENYWVDVVFNSSNVDNAPPEVIATTPSNETGISINPTITVTFDEAVNPTTLLTGSLELTDPFNAHIPFTINYNPGLHTVAITPTITLQHSYPYTLTIKGGEFGVQDVAGNVLATDVTRLFTTIDAAPLSPAQGPGGPILVISSSANPFGLYTAEILRAEGLNEFATIDISAVTASILNNYDVVVLGETPVNASQVTLLTDWVNAGGTLVAFRPDANLSSLFGITSVNATLSDKYLLVNTSTGPGVGIVDQTIQFHGTADLYTLNGASSLAYFYSDANTATTNPAVTTIDVGTNGGKAIAFTYDLPKSIIYTRQGNPAWAGSKRDGTTGPIRSDDLFFGLPSGSGNDWIDFNKIAIPQADEQQRLLANIIIQGNLHRKPLPRFWYLPRSLKAAIVMTGDDHSTNGTVGRFNQYLGLGPNSREDVANWTAIRGTSYIYPNTAITNSQIITFQNLGFEISLHPNTNCSDFTPASLENIFTTQLNDFTSTFPGAAAPVTNRTHCLVWSDWSTHAQIEANHGIRFDANYYYWPGAWVQNRPGMFTGSGMPMRFANTNGSMIDVYQGATQMTDESGIGIGNFCNTVLDRALGPEGYYGVFTANMHTDTANHTGSNAIINSALAHQVPIVSAKQMLKWIDGRNNSSFSNITWAGNMLTFNVTAAGGSTNLRGMLPSNSGTHALSLITRSGTPISFTLETIKGIEYAFFDASLTGSYVAVYGPLTTITGQIALQGRPAAPNAALQVPVTVEIYVSGRSAPLMSYTTTTDVNGQFTVSNIPIGNFNVGVKNIHTLRRVKLNQNLIAGGNNIDFGTLMEGDANNDNTVDLLDFSVLLATYNKIVGDPGYDARADYNGDDAVDLLDFSLLLPNYNTDGEQNP